jgi:hypothetical protein
VSESDDDVTRRTRLAAERTGRTADIVLGAGYAALAATVFAAAAARRRDVEQALNRGEFADLGARGVHVLTIVGMALALGTLGVTVVQP